MEENKGKLKIDEEKCIGCGYCNSVAKDNFGFGENTAIVINENITEEVKTAIECCPTGAISITE
jgi:ferredoxin